LLALAAAAQSSFPYFTVKRETVEDRMRRVSRENKKRGATLREMFGEAGCLGESYSEQEVKTAGLPNLICTVRGQGDAIIVVGAHYDVKGGDGAADNWSGASLLPSLYESLRSLSPKHTFVLIAFSGEEKGLLGSRHYVTGLSADERRRIRAMVNLDTLGLGQTKVWSSHSDPKLVEAIALVADGLKLPVTAQDVERFGSTDSEPFRNFDIPVLAVHSLSLDTLRLLHTPRDSLKNIRWDDYYASYQLMAAFLAYLDSQ
jgi:Peptidase family M28